MPIYEYECEKCGKRFERLVWSSEKVEPRCECGGEARKVFSVSSCSTGGQSSPGCDSGSCAAGSTGYDSGDMLSRRLGFQLRLGDSRVLEYSRKPKSIVYWEKPTTPGGSFGTI